MLRRSMPYHKIHSLWKITVSNILFNETCSIFLINTDTDCVRPGTLHWSLELNNESSESISARNFLNSWVIVSFKEGPCSIVLVIKELEPAKWEVSPHNLRKGELLGWNQSEETEQLYVQYVICVHSESFVVIQHQETGHLCSVHALYTFREFCCVTVSRDWTSVFCLCSVYIQKVLLCYSIKQRKSLRARARTWDPQTEPVECPAVQFEGK
jgi:hypothetical protein